LFEAGALAKNITAGRVAALLTDVKPTDVIEPLSQFQQTRMERADILRLVKDLNNLIAEPQRLPPDRLERSFVVNWPSLADKLAAAIKLAAPDSDAAPSRSTTDMVAELLELVREIKRESAERAATTGQLYGRSNVYAGGVVPPGIAQGFYNLGTGMPMGHITLTGSNTPDNTQVSQAPEPIKPLKL
jgi:hypothetical protein